MIIRTHQETQLNIMKCFLINCLIQTKGIFKKEEPVGWPSGLDCPTHTRASGLDCPTHTEDDYGSKIGNVAFVKLIRKWLVLIDDQN